MTVDPGKAGKTATQVLAASRCAASAAILTRAGSTVDGDVLLRLAVDADEAIAALTEVGAHLGDARTTVLTRVGVAVKRVGINVLAGGASVTRQTAADVTVARQETIAAVLTWSGLTRVACPYLTVGTREASRAGTGVARPLLTALASVEARIAGTGC